MIEQHPIVVALLAILAIPGTTSAVASVVRTVSDAFGVNPRAVVYVVSLAVTGVVALVVRDSLPAWAGDPTLYVGAWLAWASANAGKAKTIYELLHPRLAPEDIPA